ncbi:MAG: hypothetical protein Q8942_00925 [Bacillota bacterium]|nr:hypothetical protein [Bacillota bacterium]
MGSGNNKNTNIFVYITIIIILVGLCIFLGVNGAASGSGVKRSFFFLIVPIILVLMGNLSKSVINNFFRGEMAKALEKMSIMLGWGFAIFLFFLLMPDAGIVNKASFGIPLLTLIITYNNCFFRFIKNNIIFSKILKAIMFFAQGIVIRQMIYALWEGGVWNIGIDISVGDMALFGHIALFLSSIISILELSDNLTYRKLGKWFSAKPGLKFLMGCGLVFYFKDLRTQVNDSFPNMFVYVEWIGIFAILLIIFITAFSKIRKERVMDFHERFGKHVQEIIYNKSYEGREISILIDDYINRGEVAGILTFLVGIAKEKAISDRETSRIIKPIVDFKAIEPPKLCYESEFIYITEKNTNDRKKLIEAAINNIGNYGRNVEYVYENEY